ncbi:MAG: hypothetical protein M3N34_03360 [Pseudomonadota bacterium]|nr:hypothetical protein [Pseudomonadota bacterium]
MINASNPAEWLPLDHSATIPVPDHPAGILDQPHRPKLAGQDRPARTALTAQLQATWLQILLCALAALPLLWPAMPPLTDLGGHLGRFAVQIDAAQINGGAASLRGWYSFHWHVIPNLGTDLLIQALAPQMGLEPALKAIVVIIVVLQAAGFLMLARLVHGHVPPTALLALPLVYSYPFEYGFLNFTLCTALATWALALWIHLDQAGLRLRRWLVFVPIACALWVCHLSGWALFCLFAAGVEFGRWRTRDLSWREVGLRSALPLSCLLLPSLMFLFGRQVNGAPGVTAGWFDIIDKLGMIVMALRDRWGIWDVASALALLGMIGWTWFSQRFSRHSGLVLGAMIAAVAFVLVPKHVNGTSFVDMRLVPMILAVALLAVRPRQAYPRMAHTLAVAALVFVGARFAGNAVSMVLYDRQFAQDLTVLNSMPRDAQLVSLTVKPCLSGDPWARERRTHLAGYALARRHDYANDQWFAEGGQLLRVHNPAMGTFIGDPSQTTYTTACRGKPGVDEIVARVPQAVPYLWLIEDGVARYYPGWAPIRKSPGSVLYGRASSADLR